MCNIDAIFCKLLSWRALISYLKNRKLNFLQNKWQFLLLSCANCVWADPSLPLLSCAKSPEPIVCGPIPLSPCCLAPKAQTQGEIAPAEGKKTNSKGRGRRRIEPRFQQTEANALPPRCAQTCVLVWY